MDRRAFVAGTLGLLAAPLAAEAQPAGKVLPDRVFCWSGRRPRPMPSEDASGEGLRELGYVEGQNIVDRIPLRRGAVERLPRPGGGAGAAQGRRHRDAGLARDASAAKRATTDDSHRRHERRAIRSASASWPAWRGRAATSPGSPIDRTPELMAKRSGAAQGDCARGVPRGGPVEPDPAQSSVRGPEEHARYGADPARHGSTRGRAQRPRSLDARLRGHGHESVPRRSSSVDAACSFAHRRRLAALAREAPAPGDATERANSWRPAAS